MRIKKGDTVYVRTGAYKGKTGRVLHADPDKGVVLVEGINRRKRHQRPTQKGPKGGIISVEASVPITTISIFHSSFNICLLVSTTIFLALSRGTLSSLENRKSAHCGLGSFI